MDWMEESGDETVALAQDRYPILKEQGLRYSRRQGNNEGFLEFWPAGEGGDESTPRPKDLPMDQPGVELSDQTRPIDVLGDVVSHHLVKTDPYFQQVYSDFEQSLTQDQHARLKRQYQWAVDNDGEKRSYGQWYEHSGLPAYFRGYAFQQWPNAEELYTPKQLQMFDEMMTRLTRK